MTQALSAGRKGTAEEAVDRISCQTGPGRPVGRSGYHEQECPEHLSTGV